MTISVRPTRAAISAGDWVVLRLASGNLKPVKLPGAGDSAARTVSCGKFGSFRALELVGRAYDAPVAITPDGALVDPAGAAARDTSDACEGTGAIAADNRDLHDRGTAQALSAGEIEQLKAEARSGKLSAEEIIRHIVDNSATFENKTEFSKAKYIRRKTEKFSRVVTPLRPSAQVLCELYTAKDHEKIRSLRIDALAQIVTLVDARHGSKLMVVDETNGLATMALYERMGGHGTIISFHDANEPAVELLKYMRVPLENKALIEQMAAGELDQRIETLPPGIYFIPWNKLLKTESEDKALAYNENDPVVKGEHWDNYNARTRKRKARALILDVVRRTLSAEIMEGLVIAGSYIPTMDIIDALAKYLGRSRPIVVYHPHQEPLNRVFRKLRTTRQYIDVALRDVWTREYQLPVNAPGTHPEMSGLGQSGYIMSALYVDPIENLGGDEELPGTETETDDEKLPSGDGDSDVDS